MELVMKRKICTQEDEGALDPLSQVVTCKFFLNVGLCYLLGRLWWSPELPELRWLLGCARNCELWLQHGLQLPEEAICLHQSQRLHVLDQQCK